MHFGHRWAAPDGRFGATRTREAEARVEAVMTATGKAARELDADLVLTLWRSLEKAGWRIEEHRP